MLPIIVQHLPRDRERLGLREVQMAGRLHLTFREYRALEAGKLQISNDLYERVVELCGWPRGRVGTASTEPTTLRLGVRALEK